MSSPRPVPSNRREGWRGERSETGGGATSGLGLVKARVRICAVDRSGTWADCRRNPLSTRSPNPSLLPSAPRTPLAACLMSSFLSLHRPNRMPILFRLYSLRSWWMMLWVMEEIRPLKRTQRLTYRFVKHNLGWLGCAYRAWTLSLPSTIQYVPRGPQLLTIPGQLNSTACLPTPRCDFPSLALRRYWILW